MTGSGKSFAAAYLLERMVDTRQIIVLDSKGDDNLERLARDTGGVIEQYLSRLNDYKFSEYPVVVYRPVGEELGNKETLDAFCQWVYLRGESIYYLDELTMLNGGTSYAMPGFLNLITRGRSRGCTGIYATQRPTGVPIVCWTEAQQFMVFRLSNPDDRRRIAQYTTPEIAIPIPAGTKALKHAFWYYRFTVAKPVLIKDITGGKG